MLSYLKTQWKNLGKPIYIGERLRNNLIAITWVSVISAVLGVVMILINASENRGFVRYSSWLFFIGGTVSAVSSGIFHNRKISGIIASSCCAVIFTYYLLSGETESVASLWVMAMPIGLSYFISVRSGIVLSLYYEILTIVLFYTPLRKLMGELYSESMMTRYPIIFLCVAAFTMVAMVQYHATAQREIEYAEKLNEEVERQKKNAEELERLSKAQSRFFSSMSHEIRTPLNAVIGFNEMILREETSPEVREDAQNIQSASQLLLHLINDILDMSRLESGKMELVIAPYRTENIILEVTSMLMVGINEKQLELQVETAPDVPAGLLGDAVRIKQILINLMNNAIKYTREGRVTLRVRWEAGTDRQGILVMQVEDTGVGIRKESIPNLFTAYMRADEAHNQEIEGTGLGLAIVHQFVLLMKGQVQVESEYGKGSVFTVSIPQERTDEACIGTFDISRQREQECLNGQTGRLKAPEARILIVDDTMSNLKVAVKLLKETGIQIDTAISGAEALQKTCRYAYDLILLDHFMPKMDGIECLKRIRNQEDGRCRDTRIIAVTANTGRDNAAMYLQAGFDGFISKPFTGETLEKGIASLLPAELNRMEREPGEMMEFVPGAESERAEQHLGDTVRQDLQALGIDSAQGLSFCAGDEAFYLEMLGDFAAEGQEKAEKLRSYFDAGDWNSYRILIHTLKNAANMIGAGALAREAAVLEEAVKARDMGRSGEQHVRFIRQYREMTEGMKAGRLPETSERTGNA